MSEDVKALTAEVAADPGSLAFLRLGEILRTQGQIEAAKTVVLTGLERNPDLADAHDLYARILASANETAQAKRVWTTVLELDPRHQGAHQGLGFLYYNEGELEAALDHMELALAADPTNQSVVQALQTVRQAADVTVGQGATDIFADLESADRGILLVDKQGRVLAGGVHSDGRDGTEEVAAHLAGLSQEIERAARILNLGNWQWLIIEGAEGNVHLTKPDEDALLWLARGRDIPAGRLALQAERAGSAARSWLEAQK